MKILSNQTFLDAITSVIQILLKENHELITSETEQVLALILFYFVEREQPMLCRVAIKNGFLNLIMKIFLKYNTKCITNRCKNAILRVIVRMVRISTNAVLTSWPKIKTETIKLLFSEDVSMRIWSIIYISSVIRFIDNKANTDVTLESLQPLQMCPRIFVLVYDDCIPIKIHTIKTLCRIIISPDSRCECKQLVYMGIVGLFVDILSHHEIKNCVNDITIPILVSLNKIIKLSEKWCMVFILSNGIEVITHYLKFPKELVIIAVFLIIYNAGSYSAFHTNKILENNIIEKLYYIRDRIDSKVISDIFYKILLSLINRCTDYEILHNFIINCSDEHILENRAVMDHIEKMKEKDNKLKLFRNSNLYCE
ncbi:hypothetical protein FG386_003239 [Cryptosporidium ryanae]|uniref:uncharacterized protein n=1 Tax=Cryptosporidium ryanae TaxID=515981 RepID=UPI00351A4872|nr:hypothetical protein FG386_003239 [Cryptosporidium ryanae]